MKRINPKRGRCLLVLLSMVAGQTAGCANMSARELVDELRPNFAMFDRNLTAQGAEALIEEPGFETIDLANVIGPSQSPTVVPGGAHSPPTPSPGTATLDDRLIEFRARCRDGGESCRFDRNSVQERIVAASNQRCGKYQAFLKQFQTEGSFLGHTTSIILSGLGAVFPAASTVRALSGASAIVQGATETFNREFFNELAAQVITEGINARRAEIYTTIQKRQAEGVVEYPLEAAIADAVKYHAACSTMAGLQYAAAAVQKQKEQQRDDVTAQYDSLITSRASVTSSRAKLDQLTKDIVQIADGKSLTADQLALKKAAEEAVTAAIAEVDKRKTEIDKLVADSAELLGILRAGAASGVQRADLGLKVAKGAELATESEQQLLTAEKAVKAFRDGVP